MGYMLFIQQFLCFHKWQLHKSSKQLTRTKQKQKKTQLICWLAYLFSKWVQGCKWCSTCKVEHGWVFCLFLFLLYFVVVVVCLCVQDCFVNRLADIFFFFFFLIFTMADFDVVFTEKKNQRDKKIKTF